jgi:hypothetical protein
MGIAGLVYYMIDPQSSALRRNRATVEVMAKAKDALIGSAASSSVRPGQLPCPDTNNDGVAEAFDNNGCPSGNIGRLPWKTLGLEDLRDDAGESLWYAVSTNFTRNPAGCPFSAPAETTPPDFPCYLNSDTKGQRTVSQDMAANVITSEAVAIIFAPGAVLSGQIRDAGNVNNPVNYLDMADTVNNANAAGPFISAQASSTFNDKLLVITTQQLMPVVEQRVAREVLTRLYAYKTAVGVYPWADCADGSSDNDYQNRGRIPLRIAADGGYTLPVDWGSGGAPSLPSWFKNNWWSHVIYYAAGKDYLQSDLADRPPGSLGTGIECSSCSGSTLTVTGAGSKEVVIIMTGPADAFRPGSNPGDGGYCNQVDWDLYLEDPNRTLDDTFDPPPTTMYARDRIYFCPGTPGIC